jgi:hypothetical protein
MSKYESFGVYGVLLKIFSRDGLSEKSLVKERRYL